MGTTHARYSRRTQRRTTLQDTVSPRMRECVLGCGTFWGASCGMMVGAYFLRGGSPSRWETLTNAPWVTGKGFGASWHDSNGAIPPNHPPRPTPPPVPNRDVPPIDREREREGRMLSPGRYLRVSTRVIDASVGRRQGTTTTRTHAHKSVWFGDSGRGCPGLSQPSDLCQQVQGLRLPLLMINLLILQHTLLGALRPLRQEVPNEPSLGVGTVPSRDTDGQVAQEPRSPIEGQRSPIDLLEQGQGGRPFQLQGSKIAVGVSGEVPRGHAAGRHLFEQCGQHPRWEFLVIGGSRPGPFFSPPATSPHTSGPTGTGRSVTGR